MKDQINGGVYHGAISYLTIALVCYFVFFDINMMSQFFGQFLIAFTSALAGAFTGTRAAMLWQAKREDTARNEENIRVIFTSLMLCQQYHDMCEKLLKHFGDHPSAERWIKINLIGLKMTQESTHDIGSLYSALGAKNGYLIEAILHAEWVARSAFNVSQERDTEYQAVQQSLIEHGVGRYVSEVQMTQHIGDGWVTKLKSLTSELYTATNEGIRQNKIAIEKLRKAKNLLYPED
ncbi:hypothetical protein [Methylophaga frappieri]|uniref:hypothetical protein n=1 Tax=Methylophaga frappieri (strain ATCC BAA-2434 / DSM 25690 / JAM7) TaxID=754477 RepID=UPI00059C9311|nr:hypothetical protein [Methylophaga frappieri]